MLAPLFQVGELQNPLGVAFVDCGEHLRHFSL